MASTYPASIAGRLMVSNEESLRKQSGASDCLGQRLENRWSQVMLSQAAESSTACVRTTNAEHEDAAIQQGTGVIGIDGRLQEQDDQLLLLDLVSFDHCCELTQVPQHVEQMVLQQFKSSWSGQPVPSAARQQADQLKQLPQETLGMYVAPHPRVSNGSLYKMEQRLVGARRLDVQRLVKQLQEDFPDSQHIVEAVPPMNPDGVWLDENGLLLHEADPSKASKQRPWRRYDQSADLTSTAWLPAVSAPLHLLDSQGVSYRLDVELGRLEFELHPYMSLEHQLAAKLLCSFREYHRHAALGLASFYSNKLAAMEDGLLNAREKLFTAQEQEHGPEQVMSAAAAAATAEREVAELRQLKEEEEARLLSAIESMSQLWKQLCTVRQQQAGVQLTDIGFTVVQVPPEDAVPLQADGLTRQQLDIALLVAEAEQIAGLPGYPSAFPLNQADAELTGFTLRRVESTASSHALVRSELTERLALLKDRVSSDPDDPEIIALQQQLEVLGLAPRRQPLSHQQEMELWNWAEEEVTAGRVGVYRPPRLQPCLTVLPASTGTRSAACLGNTHRGTVAGAGSPLTTAARIRNRLGLSAAANEPQQKEPDAVDTSPSRAADIAAPGAVPGLNTGSLLPVSQQGPRLDVKQSYYARLIVNGKVLGTSEVVTLKQDFTLEFRDVFSIRLLKWPDSMQLQLWEKGTFRDTPVAEFYLVVPGSAGTPHVDPQAKPYSWTSPTPVPHHKLLQAVNLLQPLGVLPATDVANWHASTSAVAGGSSQASREAAGEPLQQEQTEELTGAQDADEHALHKTKVLKSHSIAAVYPSGRLFVRCGWVADSGVDAGTASTFDGTGTAMLAGMSPGLLQTMSMLPQDSQGQAAGEDTTVHISLQTSSSKAASSPQKQLGRGAFDSMAGVSGNPHVLQTGASAHAAGSWAMVGNPLAHIGTDVEVGQKLAPPLPHVKADRLLPRAVLGGRKQHGCTANKWLSQQMLDPNDPRNAMLLELLKAREAAEYSRGAAAAGPCDIFRLDMFSEVSMAVCRAADQRAAFIQQRWQAGPLNKNGLGAMQGVHTVAPLSAKDTLELQDAYRETLALVQAASMGVGAGGRQSAVALAAAMCGRQERSLKWAQGCLVKAIEAREAAMRAFTLRLRSACNQIGSGRALGRKFKTDDVVKDAPLPEFKLDLSSLAAALAPARPLRPQRKAIKKLQACVPRDTQLVVTVQRASNLPRRLTPGGGVRQQSPNRNSGIRTSNANRYTSRERQMLERDAFTGFRSPNRATRELQGGGDWAQQAADSDRELAGQGNESLSCFVEVKFRGKVQRTAAVDSDEPMWNEQLTFSVVDHHQDLSPSALKESDSLITINVFDEVVTPTAAAKAARSAARPGRPSGLESLTEGPAPPERERRFLGCLRVPLAAIYQAEVMSGAFKLDVPPVLLGYIQSNGRPSSLTAYLTLKPRLAPPVEADEERVSGEQGEVARHARKWVAGISSLPQCRGRVIKALAVDPEGVGTLVTRYLAETPLPPALAEQADQAQSSAGDDITDQLLLSAARWVAHVPFLDDASLGKIRSNVWASNADFLAVGGGDHEEHAHLLAGFFMELGQEAYVVLGASTMGAHAAFVLTTGRPLLMSAATPSSANIQAVVTQPAGSGAAESSSAADTSSAAADEGSLPASKHTQQGQQLLQQKLQQAASAAAAAQAHMQMQVHPAAAAAAALTQRPFDVLKLRMWNPLTGQCVPVRDPACELREVGMVYSRDNIWANIQASGHPWDISWNLADCSCWRPFFGAVLPPRELASIQVPPVYADLEQRCYEELEARVEETVRDALYEARSVVVTQPNNKLSRVLKALLKEVPAHIKAINSASLAASMAMSDNMAAAAGQGAADIAREKLQQRLRLIQLLQLSHNDRVAREMRGCLINGHIIAVPFSDGYADAIAEAVLNTGLHRTVDPRVKFAMAAYVEQLGASWVCCLWIYVAAIRETS